MEHPELTGKGGVVIRQVNLYTDGACSGNPGPGGWGAVLECDGHRKELSGGERQRLFIVLALIPQPELVFLDELTTGLDAKARRSVWKTLESLKEQGLTIFLTSHFMDEVEALCDEICILRKGVSVFRGTVEQAKARCGCQRFEDAYLHLSEEETDR